MADTVKKRNPIKIMLIITIVLLLVVIALGLKKSKVYMEDEQGMSYSGESAKFMKDPSDEA